MVVKGRLQMVGKRWTVMVLAVAVAAVAAASPALVRAANTAPTFPNASTTGPTSTSLPTWTGNSSGYDRDSNLVIDSVSLPTPPSGYWTFLGSNLTFRNCSIGGTGVVFKGSNIDIEHCDISGGISFAGTNGATVAYNNIHDFGDAIHITSYPVQTSNININYNYVHAPAPTCGAHADAVQLLGVNWLMMTNNTLDMGPWFQACGKDALNSVFQIQSTQGPNNNLTISDNYVNGAGYTARFYSCTNAVFTDNYFGRDYHYGPVVNNDDACFLNKTGNVWADTGASLTF